MKSESELSKIKQALIAQWRGGQANGQVPPVAVADYRNSGQAPLSFGQQQLWFFSRLEPNSPLYNIPVVIRLSGDLDLANLQKSFDLIVARHEVLRSRFVADPEPVQLIDPPSSIPIELFDLRDTAPRLREAEVQRLTNHEVRRAFDLSKDSMIRARLLRLANSEWILIVVMHHIASDIWSWRLICRELNEIYLANLSDRLPQLPKLQSQYADFAAWQQSASSDKLEHQLGYWRQQLANAPVVLDLPFDHPRPPDQTFEGAAEFLTLSCSLTVSLQEFARRQGVTLFMALLAAFQTLIYRYSGQEDVLVGSPTAGRGRVDVENLVGNFVNTLVLRTSLKGNPSFRELLQRTRDVVLDALANQDISFETIVQELRPERSGNYLPLVQVLFGVQDELAENFRLPQVTATPMEADTRTSKFDLTLTMIESGDTLKCWAEYNTNLFEQQTIRKMLGHYQQLLEAILAQPDQPISRLPLLTEKERDQLLAVNNTRAEYPRLKCVHHLVQEQAARTPHEIALVFRDQKLSYDELNRKSNQLAARLQRFGIGPESLVAICLDRSVEMVLAVLAIMKSGAAYVPVDPSRALERIQIILQDSNARMVVTTQHWASTLNLGRFPLLCLDAEAKSIASEPDNNLPNRNASDDLAYVLYTSGSTGAPKGVQISHRAVVNFLTSIRRLIGFTSKDILLAVTSLSFDISGLELFLPLTTGARIVLGDSETVLDGVRLARLLQSSKTTVMQATPATWRMLLDSGWNGDKELRILCGGETLARDFADRLVERSGEVWNLYGPTETTIWSTVSRVAPGVGPVPIGKPISNTQVYVLDKHLNLLPAGVPGELYIGGDGLARGYLNRPELTSEKFIPNPFDETPGARLYRTGDHARFLPDGSLQFLGRRDHQVKIRGHRVELGEIESALSSYPSIRQSVVNLHVGKAGDPILVGYFLSEANGELSASQFREFLQQKLPDYAIPSAFVRLERFPLTASGKIDRKGLPIPNSDRAEVNNEAAAPRNATEESLARIWCEVLGIPAVGVHDNFFELGGHSLRLTQVISRIRQLLNVEIPFIHVFQSPTIAKLAAQIQKMRENGVEYPITPPVERRIIRRQNKPQKALVSDAKNL